MASINHGGLHYKFIPTVKGKHSLLLIDNYTFNQPTKDDRYWTCSKRLNSKCKAKVRFDHQRNIVLYDSNHNHNPPQYFINKDGPEESDQSIIEQQYLEVLEEHAEEVEGEKDHGVLLFLETERGKTILQYNDHIYHKANGFKNKTRWICPVKQCNAFVDLNDKNDIVMTNERHDHKKHKHLEDFHPDESDAAVVITSRKGKEMLLFRKYTYRKQYSKGTRSRWVCSTLKNCRGCVFTDNDNFITSAFEEHCHDPPKYYLNPNHVLDALREPVVLETD